MRVVGGVDPIALGETVRVGRVKVIDRLRVVLRRVGGHRQRGTAEKGHIVRLHASQRVSVPQLLSEVVAEMHTHRCIVQLGGSGDVEDHDENRQHEGETRHLQTKKITCVSFV
jgi:hypothetical protein